MQSKLDILERNLDRQISMVRYLEQKNGALLAVSSAMFAIALAQYLQQRSFENIGFSHVDWLGLPIVTLFICMIMTAASFFPYSESPDDSFRGDINPNGFTFFGDLRHMTAAEITSIADVDSHLPHLELDFARQIRLNAIICQRKVGYFNRGLFFFLCGLLTPLLAAFVYFVLWAGKWKFASSNREPRRSKNLDT